MLAESSAGWELRTTKSVEAKINICAAKRIVIRKLKMPKFAIVMSPVYIE
jgi:hypothetical protein